MFKMFTILCSVIVQDNLRVVLIIVPLIIVLVIMSTGFDSGHFGLRNDCNNVIIA